MNILPLGQIIHSMEFSKKAQVTPFLNLDSDINRKTAAIAGYGGMFMSAFAATREIETGQLAPFEIDHPAFAAMEAGLIVRRGRLLSPAANQLLRRIAGKFPIFRHHTSDLILRRTPIAFGTRTRPTLWADFLTHNEGG